MAIIVGWDTLMLLSALDRWRATYISYSYDGHGHKGSVALLTCFG